MTMVADAPHVNRADVPVRVTTVKGEASYDLARAPTQTILSLISLSLTR